MKTIVKLAKNQKLLSIFCGIALMIVCTACPNKYESTTSATKAEMPIDQEILGTWDLVADNKIVYTVEKIDDTRYRIKEVTIENGKATQPKIFNAFLSDVKGKIFMNIYREIKSSEIVSYYYIYRIDKKDKDNMVFTPLSEYIREKFKKEEDLKAFIEANMNLSFFFGKELILKRSGQ